MSVPNDPRAVLYPAEDENEGDGNAPYRKAVGSLTFLAVVLHPDIAFAVNSVSKFLNKRNGTH